MDTQKPELAVLENIARKVGVYFGEQYKVDAGGSNVIIIQSIQGERAYLESEDVAVIDSVAQEFKLRLTNWKIVVANDRMGLYCEFDRRFGTRPFSSLEG